ncbi:MAG: FecR family protein [Burkholderiales bacterium]|nr:FecR family protein [Burkholderiales bacterium]
MKPFSPSFAFMVALGLSATAHAADVGRVLLAAGNTVAIRGNQTVPLAYGVMIQDKDLLRTGAASNLQVRFTDESIVSLKENSELRIDEFRFSGKEDGSERGFLSLLKGGLRTVTGLVGRANHANYRLSTVTATIGIRGTDYAATLCQGDCRNSDGSLAKDGLYGRTHGISHGTNRIDVSNERDQKTFGVNENFYVADAKSIVEPLLVAPDFVSNKLESRKQGGTKTAAGGSGAEQATTGGAASESRPSTTPEALPQLQFVATQNLGPQGTPLVVSATPTIAIVGSFFDPLDLFGNSDGGAFVVPANLTTDPAGASATLATSQKLIGLSIPPGSDAEPSSGSTTTTASTVSGSVIDETTPNSLNAHWGRWTGGTFVDSSTTTITSNNQFHYLYGPLTPPEVVAAKTGTFAMSMVAGTTPTNQLGQTGTFSTSLTVNFTAQTATFGPSSFSFPSDSWSFAGGTTAIQIAPGKGAFIDQVTTGTCSGSTCLTSTPASLGKTGIFMGPAGDHLGVSFSAKTTSGPTAHAQTAKIFSCAPSC